MMRLTRLYRAVGARVVGTGGNLISADVVIEGEGLFGANLMCVVGKRSYGPSPERNISVNMYVSRAKGGELGLCSGVSPAADAVCKTEDVGAAPWC